MTDSQYVSAEKALSFIQSGHRVFTQGSACTPTFLMNALQHEAARLKDVELVSITLSGVNPLVQEKYKGVFQINSLFVSDPIRSAVNEGRADFVPVFLSDIPDLFKKGFLPIDVAIVHVSPPDSHGYCSLGLSVDIARSAVDSAKVVIAQVNPNMPRTLGDSHIHVNRFSAMVWCEDVLPEVDYGLKVDAAERGVGKNVAALIEDRSTLQLGIGTIPDAVLSELQGHKDLGVHTEMCSNGILPLLDKGVITNRYKSIHPGKIVTSFAVGNRKLYDVIDNNPNFAFLDIDYVNDPHVIRRNPKVIAVNSALEIDLTGQVCADSLGTYQYSGIGGQLDFMRGAALSMGGKPIMALTARTKKGISRINPVLRTGAGVVTTRGHIHWVVTEYGAVNLFGKNLRQRAKLLISIAHPDDRENLEKAAFERFKEL